jgi:tetratricopeptide (TPR) repeat protein
VSPRLRVLLVVVALAAAAAVATIGATVLMSTDEDAVGSPAAGLRQGAPPLLLDLGVRTDAEARALRRAGRAYASGRRAEAARVFARYDSVEADVGGAFAAWPDGTLAALEEFARARPRSAFVRLHLGLARFWSRRDQAAVEAWRAAGRVEPDSASAVRAEDLLHPNMATGLPVLVPDFGSSADIARLSPPRQLERLRRDARGGGLRAQLRYGVALQRIGRPLSARRLYDAAAAAHPDEPEAQVAAAVARFDKDDPARAFSRLGPLARRFPRAATVRFHLGLLLLWLGRVEEARPQLERARALGGAGPIGREANRFLSRLEGVGQ